MKLNFVLLALVFLKVTQISLELNIAKKRHLHKLMDENELNFYFGTFSNEALPDYEIINLPKLAPQKEALSLAESESLHFNRRVVFKAFDSTLYLDLHQNSKLVSPFTRQVLKLSDKLQDLPDFPSNCHFLHKDGNTLAAISNCFKNEMNGIILLPNDTFEIQPLSSRLRSVLYQREALLNDENQTTFDEEQMIPHLIKRAVFDPKLMENDFRVRKLPENFTNFRKFFQFMRKRRSSDSRLTIETAIFFDEAAYRTFAPHFDYDTSRLRDMILAQFNAVQALYHHPSLGKEIDFTIVYLEIMQSQPKDFYHFNGEREDLLDSFCAYQKRLNPGNDSDPRHWDLGVYVSGLDFYAVENGRKNGVTMGLATVGGVCIPSYSCVIAEFGTKNIFGKPYPSAGFTSVYILAHEIGHNLGMHHDSIKNFCAKDGFIMSPSRGTQGETTWSSCSAEAVHSIESWAKCILDEPSIEADPELDSNKFHKYPGQVFTAKKQCEILLTDKDATIAPSSQSDRICQNLHCRTPHRSGYYFAGPALDGTVCGDGRWCEAGVCVMKKTLLDQQIIKGGWGRWKYGPCQSGCLHKSNGFQVHHRFCDNPPPVNTDDGCEGPAYQVTLCKDELICSYQKRLNPVTFASKRCREFSKYVSFLDSKGEGLQAPHESRLWVACAVFCRRNDTRTFYTPRLDLNDLGIEPYFPDGTLCHEAGGVKYYCQQHHCLSEDFKHIKQSFWLMGEEIPLMNNVQHSNKVNEVLIKYFSVDERGKSLLNELPAIIGGGEEEYNEDEWSSVDYKELPSDLRNMY